MQERFEGALLGGAVGDALGGKFEARPAQSIRARFPTARSLVESAELGELWYTDDTQMTLGVAECLVEAGGIDETILCRAFVGNYVPSRGYGRGTRAILEAMEDGSDYRVVAESYFPGGSLGNGAAMRVAPVGLFYRDHPALLLDAAKQSALPTHSHPLGIEGAQLQALAVSLAAKASPSGPFDRAGFFDALLGACKSAEFRAKLETGARVESLEDLQQLGNGITALDAVPTAIASFGWTPHSYVETIGNAILLGGDTDTIAGMAGGISGAFLGTHAIPEELLGRLEDVEKGRGYIREIARKLLDRSVGMRSW